jgi:hypothetical protein
VVVKAGGLRFGVHRGGIYTAPEHGIGGGEGVVVQQWCLVSHRSVGRQGGGGGQRGKRDGGERNKEVVGEKKKNSCN